MVFVVTLLTVSSQFSAISADTLHPDRTPYFEIRKAQIQQQHPHDARPVRLKSEVFLPDGTLEQNLVHARSLHPAANTIHAIARFQRLPSPAQQVKLATFGIRVLHYLPDDAFLVSLSTSISPDQLRAADVNWLGAIYSEDKLPPRVQSSGIGSWAVRAGETADLRLKYYEDVDLKKAAKTLEALGVQITQLNEDLLQFTANVPLNKLAELAAMDWLRWIEEVPPPPAPFNDGSRANVQANAVQATPYNLSGAGVVVGEFDVGYVDSKHGDLAGRVVLADGSNTVVNLHSTHVAGTMAGNGNSSFFNRGLSRQWRGMAPATKIISYTFTDSLPKHKDAIRNYGIVVSQNSWGHIVGGFFGNCSLYGDYGMNAPDYDRIITGLYGDRISVVFAAGNARNNFDTNGCGVGPYHTIGPPGTGKNIITVGAINSDDNSMTTFSSWGPTDDGRLKPELVAPGDEVGGDGGITSTAPGNSYSVLRGTSMAAPAVSGAVALLVEDFRNRFGGAQSASLDGQSTAHSFGG